MTAKCYHSKLKKEMKNRYSQSGQVLLLVLLAMAALATMTLSVVSRSTSEVAVTSNEEESLRAFSAAEAGVEEALVNPTVGTTLEKDLQVPAGAGNVEISSYSANIENYPTDSTKFPYPFELLSGETASVWFVTRDGDNILPCGGGNTCYSGAVTLCWGKVGAPQPPAIVASVLYNKGGVYTVATVGFDDDATRRSGGIDANQFSAPIGSCTGANSIAGQQYRYRASIDLNTLVPAATPILMRVSMLYNETTPHLFGVSTSGNLPRQGRKVSSQGQSGEATRKIDAFLLNPEMPFIFDGALYSSNQISK